jgi:hypothetical protein
MLESQIQLPKSREDSRRPTCWKLEARDGETLDRAAENKRSPRMPSSKVVMWRE